MLGKICLTVALAGFAVMCVVALRLLMCMMDILGEIFELMHTIRAESHEKRHAPTLLFPYAENDAQDV